MSNKNKPLPDWLYESLPYGYVFMGFATMLALRNAMGFCSGLTLVSAGLAIWSLRYRYRQAAKEMQLNAREPDPFATEAEEGMAQISWRSSMEVGHPLLDEQHRHIFGLSNDLIRAVLDESARQDIDLLLADLIDKVAEHFRDEEKVLGEFGHAVLARHSALHKALLEKARNLVAQFERGQAEAGEVVGFMAYTLVFEHVVKEDRKFAGDVIPAV